MTAVILPATSYDIEFLARHMRASDVQECECCARKTARMNRNWSILGDLCEAAQDHQVWSMWSEDGLMGLGGVRGSPENPALGAIWFLGTELADEKPKTLTRCCKRFAEVSQRQFIYLMNMVPTSAKKRKRWLRALGFDILPQKAKFSRIGLDTFVYRPDTARI